MTIHDTNHRRVLVYTRRKDLGYCLSVLSPVNKISDIRCFGVNPSVTSKLTVTLLNVYLLTFALFLVLLMV